MKTWHENPKTTPPQETPLEPELQNNNELTAAEAEEQARLLTGEVLSLSSLLVALSTSLEAARQSNSATPVMVVHLSSALLATVSLSMSTYDLLRIWHHTWKHLLPTMLSEAIENDLLPTFTQLIDECQPIIWT